MFDTIAFYVFAILVLPSFIICVFTTNILYSLASLAFGMILVSGFFFLLNAEFLGVVQIIVYTGAVVVMYAFGMMFFDSASEIREKHNSKLNLSFIVSLLFIGLFIIFGDVFNVKVEHSHNTNDLAKALFNDYIVTFEVAAIMLLMAMIGSIAVGIHKSHMDLALASDEEHRKHPHGEYDYKPFLGQNLIQEKEKNGKS